MIQTRLIEVIPAEDNGSPGKAGNRPTDTRIAASSCVFGIGRKCCVDVNVLYRIVKQLVTG